MKYNNISLSGGNVMFKKKVGKGKLQGGKINYAVDQTIVDS